MGNGWQRSVREILLIYGRILGLHGNSIYAILSEGKSIIIILASPHVFVPLYGVKSYSMMLMQCVKEELDPEVKWSKEMSAIALQ